MWRPEPRTWYLDCSYTGCCVVRIDIIVSKVEGDYSLGDSAILTQHVMLETSYQASGVPLSIYLYLWFDCCDRISLSIIIFSPNNKYSSLCIAYSVAYSFPPFSRIRPASLSKSTTRTSVSASTAVAMLSNSRITPDCVAKFKSASNQSRILHVSTYKASFGFDCKMHDLARKGFLRQQ